MTNAKVQRKTVLSGAEIDEMMNRADQLKHEYFKLRAKAIVAILARTGKRREEVATLQMNDLRIEGNMLSLMFSVGKKRLKSALATAREKQISLRDRYAVFILDYYEYMNMNHPYCKFLFPSVKSVFGVGLAFSKDKHLSGRQVLRIIKALNPRAWCHLFRETQGAKIARGDPSIVGVFKIMRRLDLKSETSALRYVRRYAIDQIETEENS